MTSYLNASQAEKTQRTCRYMCELVSNELEINPNGIPVPKDCQTVDVVVTEPGVEVIKALIAATDWLSGYTRISHKMNQSAYFRGSPCRFFLTQETGDFGGAK